MSEAAGPPVVTVMLAVPDAAVAARWDVDALGATVR